MIPDSIRPGTTSRGERRLFQRFRREVPNNFFVLHSLDITTHQKKLWAEADFVVISSEGILILEVKSGGVACRDGRWIFTDKHGQSNSKLEGPFKQASTAKFAVKEIVEKDRTLRGFLYGYGVIMPDEDFRQEGSEIDLNVLLPASRYHTNLGEYIDHLSRYWQEELARKHGRNPRRPDMKTLERVRQMLRPDIRSAYTLNSALTNLEKEQVELTEEQSRILQRLDSNPRTFVTGGAGTGKTLLAVDKAVRLTKEGKKVLLLCYNRLLGEHIHSSVRRLCPDGHIEAQSIHSWFNQIVAGAGMELPVQADGQSDKEFYEEVYPQKCMDALVELDTEPFDTVLLDEGQDLLRAGYLEAVDLSLRGGLEEGSWHIFMDPLQNIFKSDLQNALERLENFGFARFPLTINCRNTLEVATATATFSGFMAPLDGALEGGERDDTFYESDDMLLAGIEKKIEQLRDGGVDRKDIVILSRYRHVNSAIAVTDKIAGMAVNDLTESRSPRKNSLDFSTVHGFKGLERRAVIAVDMVNLLDEESRLLHYCGLSRARGYLACFIPTSEKASFEKLATEFGIRLAARTAGE
jgi:hypothetical protein